MKTENEEFWHHLRRGTRRTFGQPRFLSKSWRRYSWAGAAQVKSKRETRTYGCCSSPSEFRMKFNPKNIPIPEAYIIGIALGVLLHLFFSARIFHPVWTGHLLGWPLIILGTGLSVWAVIESGEMDISASEELVTSGPFAFSRNPMYVGWSLIYLGISFVLNSIWLVALFPFVMVYVHFIEIPKEEMLLEKKFGSRYRDYRNQVRRYL